MSKRHEKLTAAEIESVARIRAAGGDVEEIFDLDDNRSFKIVRAARDNKTQIALAGSVRITEPAK